MTQQTDESNARRLDRARGFVEKQQFHEALTEYQRVATLNPQDDEAQYELALLHIKLGTADDLMLAHQALLKVIRLNPARSHAHVQVARLYLMDEQPAKARLHADAILALQPTHPDGHLLRGQSLIREGSVHEGMAEIKKSIEADPELIEGYLELARTHAKQHDYAAAETVLREALQVNPMSAETSMVLGDVLEAAGRVSEAESEYRRGLDVDSKNGALYFRLAILNQRQKRPGEAEAIYHQWIHVVPKDVGAHVALAQFYGTTGRLKEALESYQRARLVDSSSMVAREALIVFYLETSRLNEAGREIDELLKLNPRNIGGRVLQARLQLMQGQLHEALSVLQELGREAPRSAMVHQYLGVALARVNKLPEAVAALEEARKLDPSSNEIRTYLAEAYLSQGRPERAVKEGEIALQLSTHNLRALRILGDAHLRTGDMKQAHESLMQLAAAIPHDPTVQYGLGLIARAQHRDAAAMEYFEEALRGNVEFFEPLDQIVEMSLSQGKIREARNRVQRQIKSVQSDPRLHNLAGQLWIISQNFAEAEAAFKKAMSLDESLLSTYANLGELYVRQGKVRQAISEFEAIMARSPQHAPTMMVLGMLHEQQGEFPSAIAQYENALRVNPRFAPAANNLAWLLIEHGGDKDRALSYAESARQISPRDPYIADTLGWVYYHKQMYGKSVGLLKEALERAPRQSLILYHYGMAQYGNNNIDEAKKSLTKFITLSPADAHADKAKEVLATLSVTS